MNFDAVFKYENVGLLFEPEAHAGDFIAEADDRFSDYMGRGDFGREWAMAFPPGRYVITVFQRYSVYKDGKRIWKNDNYINEVGEYSRHRSPRFVVILDEALYYTVPGWDRPLISHTVRDREEPLQAQTFFDIETAEMAAEIYSEEGFKAAVAEWFEDYNMY